MVLLRSRDFRRGLFVNVTLYATLTSFFFVLGLYLQSGRGDTPMTAGLTFVPVAAGNFLASLSSSSLVGRFGRNTLTIGAGLQVAGLLLFLAAADPDRPVALLLAGATLFGLGQGLLVPPIIGLVLSRVPVADSGAASGVLVTIQQLSGTIGLALVSLGFFAETASGTPGTLRRRLPGGLRLQPGARARLDAAQPAARTTGEKGRLGAAAIRASLRV